MKRPILLMRFIATTIDYLIFYFLLTILTSIMSALKIIDLVKLTVMADKLLNTELLTIDPTLIDDTVVNEMVYIMRDYMILNMPTFIASALLIIVLFILVPSKIEGKTFGKWMLKLRIVASDSTYLTSNNYALRAIFGNGLLFYILNIIMVIVMSSGNPTGSVMIFALLIQGTILYMVVDVIFIVIRKDRRAIHDMVSKTLVIRENS